MLRNLGPGEPEKTEHAAAILLYVLLPGLETDKCSACKSHAGNGPFARCLSGGTWTDAGCICCYHTGTRQKCDLARRKHRPCSSPSRS